MADYIETKMLHVKTRTTEMISFNVKQINKPKLIEVDDHFRFCMLKFLKSSICNFLDTTKEPVHKEKSLRHFHVITAVAQPSSCSVAHVYMLA